MSDPYVREVGHIDWEIDDGVAGIPLSVGVDYDTVTIGCPGMTWRLTASQMEELAQLLVSATWQAAVCLGDEQGRLAAGVAAAGAT